MSTRRPRGTKKRMPRKKKPVEHKRSEGLHIRLTPGEWDALEAAAGEADAPELSAWAREILLRHVKVRKLRP